MGVGVGERGRGGGEFGGRRGRRGSGGGGEYGGRRGGGGGGYAVAYQREVSFLEKFQEAFSFSKLVQKCFVLGVLVVLVLVKLPLVVALPFLIPLALLVLFWEWSIWFLAAVGEWALANPGQFLGWLVVVVVMVGYFYKKIAARVSRILSHALFGFALVLALSLALSSITELSSFFLVSLLLPLLLFALACVSLLLHPSSPPPFTHRPALLKLLQETFKEGNFEGKYLCFFFFSSSSRLGNKFGKELIAFYEEGKKEGGVEFVCVRDEEKESESLESLSFPFPSFPPTDVKETEDIFNWFHVEATPSLVVLSPEGEVSRKYFSFSSFRQDFPSFPSFSDFTPLSASSFSSSLLSLSSSLSSLSSSKKKKIANNDKQPLPKNEKNQSIKWKLPPLEDK